MKNRIWNKAGALGMAVVLLSSAVGGKSGYMAEVRAASVDSPGIFLSQSAQWTDPGQYRAEIVMEVSGLKAYTGSVLQASTDDLWEDPSENLTEGPETAMEEPWQEPETNPTEAAAEEVELLEVDYETQFVDMTESAGGEYAEVDDFAQEDYMDYAGELLAPVIPQLELINYISEYFIPDGEFLSGNCRTEEIPIRNQKGEETTVTKVVETIDLTTFTEDILQINIPVILREEYRNKTENVLYPVSQDEPLMKDCPGMGAQLQEKTETGNILLFQTASPVLELLASKSDFCMELKGDSGEIKGGQAYTYALNVTNTGEVPLSDILIKSNFSINKANTEEIKAVWESAAGVQVNGRQALISSLGKGETCMLRMTVKLAEDQSGDILHTVYAQTYRPGTADEIISREAEAQIHAVPLSTEFTVEKTADRTEACPGDTITYQICIRNTGERTLHSVLSTERFINANIQAQFMPKEGVVLNSTRTQALIREIAPGQAFALLATVTLPMYLQDQELVNRVTVISEETGERSVEADSQIAVAAPLPTPVVTPYYGQTYYQSGTKNAYAPSSKPKTGDDAAVGWFVVLLIFGAMSAAGILTEISARRSDRTQIKH